MPQRPSPPSPATRRRSKPEILAPAGGRQQLEAAVWAGADAVYFGLDDGLNARARATAFAADALSATMDYLHEHAVRGYLTLNTLVFDEELETAERMIRQAASAGVDALIVQDIGLVELARVTAPNLPVHASTQMSVTDAAGVAFAASLGCQRVVIGRELSIEDIAGIAAESPIAIEAFVHGALCVSYSGQCFSSEAWGGRSANRGQCAQACRLPYGMIVDGKPRDIGDARYLLSPQDLMALELLPQLVDAGVQSLKIEGRLKGPDYVVSTVSAYRETLDSLWERREDSPSDARFSLGKARRRHLAQVFSRGQDAKADGLTPGFLQGPQHQSLVLGRNPRHRGLCVGEVIKVAGLEVQVELTGPLKRGDGIVFDQGHPDAREIGGNIYAVRNLDGSAVDEEIDSGSARLRLADDIPLSKINPGDLVWRSRDASRDKPPGLDPRLANLRAPVDIQLRLHCNQPLKVILIDGNGLSASSDTRTPLRKADGQPLDESRLRKAIGLLGDTPLRLGRITLDQAANESPLFVPLSEIKAARREVVAGLLAQRRQHQQDHGVPTEPALPRLLPIQTKMRESETPLRVSLLCRTEAQVIAALDLPGVDEIVIDFLEVHGLKQACEAVRQADRRLVVAAPRIFKPGEERLWRYYCRLLPDGLLVRSTGLLHVLARRGGKGSLLDNDGTLIPPLLGDFSLNAANVLSVRQLLALGVDRLTLTHDLNAEQIQRLAGSLPDDERSRLEVVAHQHLPIFHTEYCVFARYLSTGNSYRDCGRPCERHTVHIRDANGGDHLVQADIGCRNTVFNAAAQSAAEVLGGISRAGIQHIRIELVDEPADDVPRIVAAYQALASGELDAKSVHPVLAETRDANGKRQGVGPGSLAVRVELPRTRMKRPTAR